MMIYQACCSALSSISRLLGNGKEGGARTINYCGRGVMATRSLFRVLRVRAISRQGRHYSSSLDNSSEREKDSNTLRNEKDKDSTSFEALLDKSRLLTSCGHSPVDHTVLGEIVAVVNNEMYVDFGGKFHGVVLRPKGEEDYYHKGTQVEVKVKDLEITEHFLGHSRDTSLLEAEIELLGPLRKTKKNILNSNTSTSSYF